MTQTEQWIAEHGGSEAVRIPGYGDPAFATVPVPRIVWHGSKLRYVRAAQRPVCAPLPTFPEDTTL